MVKIVIFGQNCEFWLKLWILVKIMNLVENVNIGQKCEFWSKLWLIGSIWWGGWLFASAFALRLWLVSVYLFWSKLWILVKIVNFGKKYEIWSKLWFLVKIVNFGWNYEFWSKLWIWLKMWILVKSVNFGRNCDWLDQSDGEDGCLRLHLHCAFG